MSRQSTISVSDEIWGMIKETQKNLKEFSASQKKLQASQKEFQASQKETDRYLKNISAELSATQKETSQQMKETDRYLKNISAELSATQKETSQQMKETDRYLKNISAELSATQKETSQQMKETDRYLKNISAELSATQKETSQQMKETDKKIKAVIGDFGNRWGKLGENLVKGHLVQRLKERGIEVERVITNAKNASTEFDIIAVNGTEVVVVEVKATLDPSDVSEFAEDIKNFKIWWPEFKDKTIYGAMAFLIKANKQANNLAQKQGFFVIEATGDVIIQNKDDFEPTVFS